MADYKYLRELARKLADVIVWLAIATAWALCCVQVATAWKVWQTQSGIYGIVGGLALFYVPPVLLIYLCAVSFATHSRHTAIMFPLVIGFSAMIFANQINR